MRWKVFNNTQWHRVFAWKKVQIGDTWVWLEFVERRWHFGVPPGYEVVKTYHWQYRFPMHQTG